MSSPISPKAKRRSSPTALFNGKTTGNVVPGTSSSEITLDINKLINDEVLFAKSSYGNGAKSVTFLPIPGNKITTVKDGPSTIWSEEDGVATLVVYENAGNYERIIVTVIDLAMNITMIYFKKRDNTWLPISRANYFKCWTNFIANALSFDISMEIPEVIVTRFKRKNHEAKTFIPIKGMFIETVTEHGNVIWFSEGSECTELETYKYSGRMFCALYIRDMEGKCKELISERDSGVWIRCVNENNHTLKRAVKYDLLAHNNPGIRLKELLTLKHARVNSVETEPGCNLVEIRNGREVIWKFNKEKDVACRKLILFVNVKMKLFDFDIWHIDGSVTKVQIGNLNGDIGGWKHLNITEGSEFRRITMETGFKWHEKLKHRFFR